MAFDGLSGKLSEVFKKLRGMGKLTEKDVAEAMRHVRLALLEADVSFKIVKEFVNNVSAKAVGEEVMKSLTPGQHVIKLVNEELVALMGGTNAKLTFSSKPPTVYMLAGLQGAGKTTTGGKIAGQLRKQGKKPLLVACDIYRPAAVKQLQVVGAGYGVPVFEQGTDKNPVDIAKAGLAHAEHMGNDVVIIDTAGRLHIDDELMNELINIKAAVRPQEILLVVDAMTGQDAVNVAESFSEKVGIDGVIVTKLDSDTRGGAVLSVRKITGKPIKYVGMGEKMDELEPFYPDRMANRILGMGDVLTLIEKAQSVIDEEEAVLLEKKLRKNEFDLEDFLSQIQQLKKMGPLKNILGMIPGMNQMNIGDVDVNDKSMGGIEAIIRSMTPKERRDPDILNASRKRRIAAGSGRTVQEINQLLKNFDNMKKMMKQFTDGPKFGKGKKGKFNLPF
ncbi:MAG: signal recognition particle protein [Defluviitaleaceae bacterium]|nr:signal recognition particle protein [Defluviitaleaceae bacterium]MCL2835463.1 signal recognition particle protein [Defluviitaleaceae bacterium]